MSDSFNQFRKQVSGTFEGKRWSAKSITAMILFGAIILVFVLFGFPNNEMGAGGAAMGSAARVNNTLIPLADLRSESSRIEQMYPPLFGGAGMGDAQRQFVVQQALEGLINQELVSQMAKKEGILATDPEIQDVIVKEIPAFQKDGRFQRDLYYGVLEANRLNAADFESKLRKEKTGIRTQRLFEAAAVPLSFELQKLKMLQETKLNVAFARVDKEKILRSMQAPPSEVTAKLENADFYKKVQENYSANKAEFVIEPQVHAQHILIKIDEKTNESKAKALMEDVRKKAQTEDFGKLAKQYSQDEGSKDKNGDLGFFGKGRMVPEFEAAAFQQKVGAVGEPVKSQFGFHLIKVIERKEGGERSLIEVKTEIAQKLMATDSYDAEVKALEEALAKADSAAIDAQLKKMGATWDETGFFDMSADMVPKLNSPEASKAAFQLSDSKKIYPTLIRDNADRFVLKLKEIKKDTAATAVAGTNEQIARERSSDLFRTWVETGKKTAKIERNNAAVTNAQ
ncbi:MAG: peptidylprolyl isomerase [Pseudobdellovibrionaceae bacterium]